MLDFNNENENTVDIPEFVEDKSESMNIDKSIFEMSNDELYDDVDEQEEEVEVVKTKKTPTKLLFVITTVVFLVLAIVFGVLFAKEKSNVADLESQVKQLQASQTALQQQVSEKDNTISALNSQIEAMKKADEGTKYKVTADSVYFRTSASVDAIKTSYNGHDYAWKNEEFKVLEVVTDSSGNKWAKINDNTYFAIVYDGEALASKVE